MKEKVLNIKANVKFEVFDEHGNLKQVEEHNLVLNDGLDIVAGILTNIDPGTLVLAGVPQYLRVIAVGDNNTASAVTDTDLVGTELSPTGRKTTVNTVPSQGLARYVATFNAGEATGTWYEAVLADRDAAKGARNCACRVAPINIVKGAGDTVTVTWDLTFS